MSGENAPAARQQRADKPQERRSNVGSFATFPRRNEFQPKEIVDLTLSSDESLPPVRKDISRTSIIRKSSTFQQPGLGQQQSSSPNQPSRIDPLERLEKNTPGLSNTHNRQQTQETLRMLGRVDAQQFRQQASIQRDWPARDIAFGNLLSSRPTYRQIIPNVHLGRAGQITLQKALARNEVSQQKHAQKCRACQELGVGCDGELPCSSCAEPGFICEYANRASARYEVKTTPQVKSPATSISKPNHLMGIAPGQRPSIQDAASNQLRRVGDKTLDGLQVVMKPFPVRDESHTNVSSSKSETQLPILEPDVFLELLNVYETKLEDYREYSIIPRLRQSKIQARQAHSPRIATNLSNPFNKLVSTTLDANQASKTKTKLQIQTKQYGKAVQSSQNKWRTVVVPLNVLNCETRSLPKYKSIGRTGPSLLARNVKTAHYWAYDTADERQEDKEISKKYNEFRQRYEHNDDSMKSQRKCLEITDAWKPWAEQLLQRLQISWMDILFYYLHDSEEGWRPTVEMSQAALSAWTIEQRAACKTCHNEGDWDKDGRWKIIARQIPSSSGRAHATAGLICHAFHKLTSTSLWHIASTSNGVNTLMRSVEIDETPRQGEELCLICYLHNCPTHGRYDEWEGDDTSGEHKATINDDEKENNERIMISLPGNEPGEKQEHLCGVYCVDRSLLLTEVLGLRADNLVSGSRRIVKETLASFEDNDLCSGNCFWDVRRRQKCKISELTRGNPAPLSRQQFELFECLLPLHLNNRRAPCLLANIIEDATCIDMFYHMLNRIGKVPHTISIIEDMSDDIINGQRIKKAVKIPTGVDTSNSAALDSRSVFVPCSHEGPCHNNPNCSCSHDHVFCEWFCGCDLSCKQRYKGCSCAAVSKTCFNDSRCDCWNNYRECDPFLCKGCGVLEVLDSSNKYNEEIRRGRCKNCRIQLGLPARTIKAPSEVQGYGLFAGEDLDEHTYIGDYPGEIVSIAESDRRGAVYHVLGAEYLFTINRDQDLDASNVGNKMRFMNNSQKESNINVAARKMMCNGVHRVMLYAKRKIKAGEELLYNYNYPMEVTKNFWERGEKPSSATGTIMALGPKTTGSTDAQPRKNGRFARKTEGMEVEDEGSAYDSSHSLTANRSKRKRGQEDGRQMYSVIVPAKTDSLLNVDEDEKPAIAAGMIIGTDESDYVEESEQQGAESEDDANSNEEDDDLFVSDGYAVRRTSKTKIGRPQTVALKDGRFGRAKGQSTAQRRHKTETANRAVQKGRV